MIFPGLFYNSTSLGISRQQTTRHERALTIGNFFTFNGGYSYFAGLSLRYNSNFTLHSSDKLSGYIPIWFSPRYVFYSGSSEGDGVPAQAILYTLGSGYGMKFHLKNKHALRLESGLGLCLVTYRDYTVSGGFKKNFRKDEEQPFRPAFRLTLKYLIPL